VLDDCRVLTSKHGIFLRSAFLETFITLTFPCGLASRSLHTCFPFFVCRTSYVLTHNYQFGFFFARIIEA